MLIARDLVFRAGERILLNDVSATFPPGKLHLIIGANGAGKSTLIRILARLLQPHSGQVTYAGLNATRHTDRQLARHRAMLSQAVEVAFPIPVHELVMMGRYPHFRGRPGAIDQEICEEVMRYFDVTEFAERSYGTLSGGERQRVNFARVLAQIWRTTSDGNRYLFLDEPLTFLDIRHQIDFMKKIRTFSTQQDVVTVGVIHDLNLAAKFADRLILLHHGKVMADGTVEDVLTRDYMKAAFDVTPVRLTNSETGERYLAFD